MFGVCPCGLHKQKPQTDNDVFDVCPCGLQNRKPRTDVICLMFAGVGREAETSDRHAIFDVFPGWVAKVSLVRSRAYVCEQR